MKRHSFLLLLLMSFALSACNNEKENAATKPAVKLDMEQEDKQENSLGKIEKINLKVSEDSLMSLPPGTLMTDFSYEEDIKDIGNSIPEMDPDIKNQLPSQLEQLTKDSGDLKTIKKGLLALLASPHYRHILEKSMAYQPQFDVPFCQIQQGLGVTRKKKRQKRRSFYSTAPACCYRQMAE